MMATIAERIERLSMPEPNSGCWLWIGNTNHLGYGQIMMAGKRKERAHRVSYQTFCSDIPTGMHVLHRCDNRCCVNPDHLFLGTRSDNMADMHAKRRHPRISMPGESHPAATITEEMVRIIRSTPKGTRGLAKRLGTTHRVVHQVRSRLTWKHIGD